MDERTQAEVVRALARGARQVSVRQFCAEYARLGYRFDRALDCAGITRTLSGPHSGTSYPALNLYPREIDTGRSAWHFESRRDDNFKAMQRLRGEMFAVSRGRIVEV